VQPKPEGFAIQTAVAEEIARTLQARISPAQKVQIERKPAQSPEAYIFARASMKFGSAFNRPTWKSPNDLTARRFWPTRLELHPVLASEPVSQVRIASRLRDEDFGRWS
jgi:hypothetical protein